MRPTTSRSLFASGALALSLCAPAPAQTVTRVRAAQLADRTVEVLYDLSGAGAEGATVSVAFSSDGGESWDILPDATLLSGHVGAGIADGADRRRLARPHGKRSHAAGRAQTRLRGMLALRHLPAACRARPTDSFKRTDQGCVAFLLRDTLPGCGGREKGARLTPNNFCVRRGAFGSMRVPVPPEADAGNREIRNLEPGSGSRAPRAGRILAEFFARAAPGGEDLLPACGGVFKFRSGCAAV